ncbi:hypothetical protein BS78_07G097900 [Paspalum vaginatum]|nr:hypothetical protein BS78_07G097900 [Paspalum vaginatum]KAJ1267945.1 hypothetical protein BS78_07G097900 [Paspalum vaginatum]KAJ1267946.1 hypothetical protein BS78_07G097900 [Paspalum vaginatum]
MPPRQPALPAASSSAGRAAGCPRRPLPPQQTAAPASAASSEGRAAGCLCRFGSPSGFPLPRPLAQGLC